MHIVDRSKWKPGPWDNEPEDRIEFEHRGMACLMVRARHGSWCGYAAIPPGHPAHGKDYDNIDVDVHGGLTYANACQGAICHVAKPGEPDDVWWVGFDTAHCYDVSPGMLGLGDMWPDDPMASYRDAKYVKRECQSLVEQLLAR